MATYPLTEFAPSAMILRGKAAMGIMTSTHPMPPSLSNISHELRRPLAQISAPLEVLKNSDGTLSESERKHLYGIIGLQTSRMLELLEQLLLLHPNAFSQVLGECPQNTEALEAEGNASSKSTLTPKRRRTTSDDDGLLDKVFGLIEANLEETDFNVHKMCRMVHMSHMHFIRKVKQLTGKKPIDLLKSFRLKRAQELLRENKLTVAEIAYRVGYDMPNSFSRAFKKEFGICPSEYMG